MNEKINLDIKSLSFIFNRNKVYIFPVIVMLISVMLFFQFIIPQFKGLLAARKEANELTIKLGVMKENLDVLINTNEQTLDNQIEVLSSALPLGKDFVGILNSVYSTAQKTGVSLGNFSIAIGDLSKSESGDNFLTIKLSLPISADPTATYNFIEAIGKTVPLSEVYTIKAGNTSSSVDLVFYYKPLGAFDYSQDVRIKPVSQEGLTLVNQLSKFENASSLSNLSIPIATSSATQ